MTDKKRFMVTFMDKPARETIMLLEIDNENYALEDYDRLRDAVYDFGADETNLDAGTMDILTIVDTDTGEEVFRHNYPRGTN